MIQGAGIYIQSYLTFGAFALVIISLMPSIGGGLSATKSAYADSTAQPLTIGVFTADRSSALISTLQKHYGDSPNYQVIDRTGGLFSQFPLQTKVMYGPSLDDLKTAISTASTLSNKPNMIVYDIEHWPLTPDSEKADPAASISQAADLVHAAGYKFGVTPDRQYLLSLYLSIDYSKVDTIIMQMQKVAFDTSSLTANVKAISDYAKSKNPAVQVMLQYSLQYSKPDDIISTTSLIRDKIDGISIIYFTDPSGSCATCNIASLESVLTSLGGSTPVKPPIISSVPVVSKTYGIVLGASIFQIPVSTNSTVQKVAFSQQDKSITITLNGLSGSSNTTAKIPMSLLSGVYKVMVDGNEIPVRIITVGNASAGNYELSLPESQSQTGAASVIVGQNYTQISVVHQGSGQRTLTILGTTAIPEFPLGSMALISTAAFALPLVIALRSRRVKTTQSRD